MIKGLFVGLSTIDLVYDLDKFPPANSKTAARSQNLFVGGPATNASVAFAHLGGKTTLLTVVGRHALSSLVAEEIERYSIQLVDLNPDFKEVPVISSIFVNEAAERIVISANASRVNIPPATLDETLLDGTSVVLVDGHYMQACQVWSQAARELGIHVVFDGGSWKEGTDVLLSSVDTAICSGDFLPPGCSTRNDVFAYLKSRGLSSIAITNGAEPIQFLAGGTFGTVPVPQVQALDTMGAGDIFHGAFCYYLSLGKSLRDTLVGAARVASESCQFRGTREWMGRTTHPRALTID